MAHFGQPEKRLTVKRRRLFCRGLRVVWYLCAVVCVVFVAANYSVGQFGETTGSQFREPQVPAVNSILDQGVEQPAESVIQNFDQSQRFDQSIGGASNNAILNPPLNSVQESSQNSFVPREKTPSGFVPVRPRDSIDEMPTDANEVIGEFQLDIPSRSKDDEEILSLLRSDRIDQAVQATRNRDGSELIKQFYPDGKVQIERYVAQDEKGNYFNHGSWKLYDRRGQVRAKGNFEDGMMNGSWERWHPASASGMLQSAPFSEFKGPFISTATFKAGKLDGVWAVFDQFQRKIAEIPYKNGLRHGTATWKYPDSSNMRIARFTEGKMDGPLYEWDRESKLVRNDEYINGRRVIKNVTFYRPKQRKSENYFLEGEYELEGDDSWWEAKPAEYVQTGSRIQHGPSYVWHENGQLKMRGSYQDNEPVGQFSWWHSNGQKELTGGYRKGLKVGQWTGWHANGMKSFEGQFDGDERSGMWRWWGEDGKVRSEKDFDQQESTEILRPKKEADDDQSSEEKSNDDQKKEDPEAGDYSDAEEITPAESQIFRPGEYPDAESESENEAGSGSTESDGSAADGSAADGSAGESSPSQSAPQFREPDIYRKDPFGEEGPASSGEGAGI